MLPAWKKKPRKYDAMKLQRWKLPTKLESGLLTDGGQRPTHGQKFHLSFSCAKNKIRHIYHMALFSVSRMLISLGLFSSAEITKDLPQYNAQSIASP